MRIFAWCVSVLFHPLLLPMYMLFITFNSDTIFSGIPVYTQRMSYMLTLLGVTMLPLLSLPLLKWLGLIGNYRLIHKQDRVFPVLATVVGAFLVFYLSRNLPFSNIVRELYLIMVILLSGFMIVTMRWCFCLYVGDEVFRGGGKPVAFSDSDCRGSGFFKAVLETTHSRPDLCRVLLWRNRGERTV